MQEIVLYVEAEEIPKEKILEWQKTTDDRILGFLVYMLTEEKYIQKIKPKLDFYDCYPFLLNGYIKCMQMDFEDKYFVTSYMAAYELRNFIEYFWDYHHVSQKEILKIREEIKKRLQNECLKANKKYISILINGLLEHLFDNKKIRKYFKDWIEHEKLKIFYECSIVKTKPIPWDVLL